MMQDGQNEAKFLREKAEASATRHRPEPEPVDLPELSNEQVHKLVHELQVHQIELEMQNEELRRVMTDLEESHRHFSLLFHRAPIGYLVLDQVGLIHEVNDTFCRMVGRDRKQLVGTPFAEYMASDDRSVFLARYRAFFKNPEENTSRRCSPRPGRRIPRASGRRHARPFPGTSTGQQSPAAAGGHRHHRAQVGGEQAAATGAPDAGDPKLESLGVLAGGIAHDFNNLLTVILGNASLALDELPPHSAAQESLEAIESTALRAAELCRQMLAYSGKGRFVIESIQLGTLIGEMVSCSRRPSRRRRF